ncbi:MAG: hypothetical protein HOO19_03415 [Rhodospirillaceae bacterium]|jgi:hypothetical protein|nr:hypothetical protein [Rhodospirillaceae bacterium]MBT5840461.1 hypothetical protein [Rhodospirillaceae bacterium]MBT7032507.1 hypothetical protein [Rhodospirillaceae bacterium]
MPDVVEIYMCKAGEKLEDGKLAVSNDIYDKEAAKTDAIKRCKISPSLARIAYYAINDNGDFKPYYSYNNPKVEEPKSKQASNEGLRKKRRKKKPAKKTFWQKLAASVGR